MNIIESIKDLFAAEPLGMLYAMVVSFVMIAGLCFLVMRIVKTIASYVYAKLNNEKPEQNMTVSQR